MRRFGLLVGVAFVVCLSVVVSPSHAQEAVARHVEKAGGFSFVPPQGWTVQEFGGLKYRIVVGPVAEGFGANINVTDEAYQGSVASYADLAMSALKRQFPDVKRVSRQDFTTASGIAAKKVVTQRQQQGKNLRQTFYIFSTGTKVFVVTFSCVVRADPALAPIVDASMETFQFER